MSILRDPNKFKRTISRFYTGLCTVEVQRANKNKQTGKITTEREIIYKDLPCRLSPESKDISAAYERNLVTKTIMLFLDNTYTIPPGSKIEVTQDDVTNVYGMASEPNTLETHQEIELVLWEDWSENRKGLTQAL